MGLSYVYIVTNTKMDRLTGGRFSDHKQLKVIPSEINY